MTAIDGGSIKLSPYISTDPNIIATDPTRWPHREPCPDCGRVYLNGENITWTVPTAPSGNRVVWSGCCDCWIRRTEPSREI